MKSTRDEPVTLAERYSTAMGSSHLEVSTESRSAIDYMISAGWCSEGLGTALFRVMTEFDAVRGEYNLTQQVFHQAMKVAKTITHEAQRACELDVFDWAKLPEAIDQRTLREMLVRHQDTTRQLQIASALRTNAERTAISGRLLALSAMKSQRATKEAVIAFAERAAVRTRFDATPAEIKAVALKAFDYWLDPLCHLCEGRGFTGGFGTPMSICDHDTGCGGSTRRRMQLGPNDRAHQFGRYLLVEMDRKTAHVADQMARYLRGRETAVDPRPELTAATHDLRQRLTELRSAVAQED